MKTFSSEFAHDYETYSFGYCNYALREREDALADIYSAGYLPYSGKLDVKDTFYMARSARVDLRRFSLSGENRRIAKRFDGTLTREIVSLSKFDTDDENFVNFCLAYFSKRHGPNIMPRERLDMILDMGLITNLTIYRKNSEAVAYVLEVGDKDMSHFWYSFYDLSYTKQSLGMWLMLDALRAAKERGAAYFYVGTVYGDKALYKANFPALEYWDGKEWVSDTTKLKVLARNDNASTISLPIK